MPTPPEPGATPVDPQLVWDLLDGFRRAKTMFAAVSLGVFDGARPAGDKGRRLLDACVALGILVKNGTEYVNTPVAETYLSSRSSNSLRAYVEFSNHVLYPLWEGLEDAVRTTDESALDVQRRRGRHLFLRHIEEFIGGMDATGRLSSKAIVEAVDLSRFRTLIDLGGATGHLAKAAKTRYPHLDVAVFDVPRVIEAAIEHFGDGVGAIRGDFVHDELPRADIFALGRVLHNISDDLARRLLSRICAATCPGGAILVAETLLDAPTHGSVAAHLQDMNMLVCLDGRERTAEEYASLLHAAGYDSVRVTRTGTRLDVVIGEKSARSAPSGAPT